MRQFRPNRYLLRPMVAVLFAVFLQGCTKWTLVPEPKSLATEPKSTVRVTLTGESKHMVVKNPSVVGDSLIWTSPQRGGVLLSEVAWMEARSWDVVATGFFALVGVTFVVVK